MQLRRGAGKFRHRMPANQLALRGDALTINACYNSSVFEAVAGMLERILRECKTNNWPPDFNPPFVNLSLRFTSQTNKGSALYLSGIILQLVSRLSLVQSHFVIILTSETNAKKETVFTTRVERAITRAVLNEITCSKDRFAATIENRRCKIDQ